MGEYQPIEKGDILEIPNGRYVNFACCDCGLVHRIDVKIKNKKTQLKFIRDNRRTGQRRRRQKITVKEIT